MYRCDFFKILENTNKLEKIEILTEIVEMQKSSLIKIYAKNVNCPKDYAENKYKPINPLEKYTCILDILLNNNDDKKINQEIEKYKRWINEYIIENPAKVKEQINVDTK